MRTSSIGFPIALTLCALIACSGDNASPSPDGSRWLSDDPASVDAAAEPDRRDPKFVAACESAHRPGGDWIYDFANQRRGCKNGDDLFTIETDEKTCVKHLECGKHRFRSEVPAAIATCMANTTCASNVGNCYDNLNATYAATTPGAEAYRALEEKKIAECPDEASLFGLASPSWNLRDVATRAKLSDCLNIPGCFASVSCVFNALDSLRCW